MTAGAPSCRATSRLRLPTGVFLACVAGLLLLDAAMPARAGAQQPPPTEEAGEESPQDLLREVVPGEDSGPFPTSHYEVPYDAGLFDVMEKVQGWLTNVVFGLARWLVRVGIWVITWAYTFAFGNELAQPAGEMADLYQRNLVGPLGLPDLALFAAAVYAGWHILRGRLPRGAGEFALSLVIAAAGTILLRNPAGVLDGGMEVVGRLSGEILSVTAGEDPPGPPGDPEGRYVQEQYEGILRPLAAGIHRAYVEEPWELMTWGALLDGTPCARARDAVLAVGPGSDPRPWDVMGQVPGCEEHADFSRRATFERLAVATLVLVAGLVVLVLLVLVAGTVVVAQLVGVGLVAVMPFALVGGILPGSGRQLLWRWASAVLRVLLAILVMSFLLSFLLFSLDALLEATEGRGLLERFGLLVILTVVLFVARKRFLRATQRVAGNLGRRMETARVGGSGPGWLAPAVAGGVTGFGIGQLADEGRQEARQVTRPADRLARTLSGPAGHRAVGRPRALAAAPALSLHSSNGASSGSAHDGETRNGQRNAPPHGSTPATVGRGNGARPGSGLDDHARTRVGRATLATSRAARTVAGTALNATVNLPVFAPRAAAAATVAASSRAGALRERLAGTAERTREWSRQYAQGVRHPIQAYREQLDRARRTGQQKRPKSAGPR